MFRKIHAALLVALVTASMAVPGLQWPNRALAAGASGLERLTEIGTSRQGTYYTAGGDRIRYIAVEFRGNFTEENIRNAFAWAMDRAVQDNTTRVVRGQQFRKQADDRHMVLGVLNQDRGKWQYTGCRTERDGSLFCITESGGFFSVRFGTWRNRTFYSDGSAMRVQFEPDGEWRGLTWGFHLPR